MFALVYGSFHFLMKDVCSSTYYMDLFDLTLIYVCLSMWIFFCLIDICLEGLFTNLEYITFFSCLNRKKHFSWEVDLVKTTLTRNNWENRLLKFSPTEYCYKYIIIYKYNTDWLWASFFLIISSQSCFIKVNLPQKCFFLNNPFNVHPTFTTFRMKEL